MLLAKLFLAFFKIGLFGFGGGLAIIQLIYDSIKEFANISPEQFANIVAIAQVTPG
ncbi:MAG: chromate transporter, partial [Mogibacterium diversum]|nr:chromate transporter [Mogibacterium diversum]